MHRSLRFENQINFQNVSSTLCEEQAAAAAAAAAAAEAEAKLLCRGRHVLRARLLQRSYITHVPTCVCGCVRLLYACQIHRRS